MRPQGFIKKQVSNTFAEVIAPFLSLRVIGTKEKKEVNTTRHNV